MSLRSPLGQDDIQRFLRLKQHPEEFEHTFRALAEQWRAAGGQT